MTTTIVWEGADDFSRWCRETPGIVTRDIKEAMYIEGEGIMAQSKYDTPVDTGRLRSTGHVKPPREHSGVVDVILAYGTDYAIYVHEILSAAHPVGKAKFLEDAVKQAAPKFTKRMKQRIQRSLARRGLA